MDPRLIDDLIKRAESERTAFQTLESNRKYLLDKYDAQFLELDGEHFSRKFETDYASPMRSLSSDYRTDIKVLSIHLLNQHKLEYERGVERRQGAQDIPGRTQIA